MITNAGDPDVNNALTAHVVEEWRKHGALISTYEFPAELGLPHDFIDPAKLHQHAELVSAQLIALVTGER